ncbi:TniQ family protein [Paenibacillus frigoriresistens]|uniref:TniQ family protein n=1 Tax=Paenibacillus alginolyticus TaxID=59839 RepID=UPI0015668329|nr:TniQ family protein [Paenibacillus frigoriresistens]NRF94562.1 TniQ family protein [Paenibacillus frigoriresistens]
MNKLLNRSLQKIENETLVSFLYRISKENDYSFPSTLCSELDLSTYEFQKNEFTSNSLIVLSGLLDHCPSDLKRMTNSFFIDAIGKLLFDEITIKNNVQYCPLCVSVDFHHQQPWCFIPITVCLKHNVYLIDRCCNCHAKISLSSYWYETCNKCDFRYKDAEPVPIDSKSFEFASQKELYEIIIEMKAPFIKELNSRKYLKLILNSKKLITGLKSFTGEGRFIVLQDVKTVILI